MLESIVTYIGNISTLQKLMWVMICLTLMWFFESRVPLFKLSYKKWNHALVNFVFLFTSIIVNGIFGLATVSLFYWIDVNNFGFLNWVSLPLMLELLITVLVFDFFGQYVAHYLLHKKKWMWKFHIVHHADTNVDVTTGTRLHPGDLFIREIFALFVIMIIGAPLAFYLFYRLLTVFFTYFTHANIHLPDKVDRALSYVFITPNMHKFHHHFERPWTDTNFGSIFSIWDRVFGTFFYGDTSKIRYGLDVIDADKSDLIGYQFTVPFDQSVKTDY